MYPHLKDEADRVNQLKALLADLGHADDDDYDQLLADTIEGETRFFGMLERLISKVLEAEAFADACKAMQGDLAIRKKRFEEKGEFIRGIIADALRLIDERKLTLPCGTLTLSARAPSVQIIDEALIPRPFLREKVEVDKTKLRDALKAGESVPGAALSNGGETLTIRSK